MAWLDSLLSMIPGRKTKGYADVPVPGSVYGRGYAGTVGIQYQPLLPGARTDYQRESGDLWRNATVAACLGWKQDNIGQARLHVVEPGLKKAPDKELPDDPAALLLQQPNPFCTLDELLNLMILSDDCDGNTYILKARGAEGYGQPEQLWWVPPWMISPWADASTTDFITCYQYRPGTGGIYYLPLSQVIHIKNGTDPRNTRLGCARLRQGLRSIVALNRGETYSAAIILNGGPIKLFIPDGAAISPKEAEGVKGNIKRASQAENSGDFTVASVPGHFEAIGSGPEEIGLNMVLDRPEATIHALLGMNAMVTGMAVGNNTRTFTNLKEAESQAWTNGLIPKQKRFAKALTQSLLHRYADGQPADFPGSETRCFQWDWSKVQALSEDETEKVTRAVAACGGPIWTVNEGRASTNMPPIEGEDLSPTEKETQAQEAATEAAQATTDAKQADSGDAETNKPDNATKALTEDLQDELLITAE